MNRNRTTGFTLIELLVVVVIVGILGAIAIPNYTDYVRRGKLTEASTELTTLRTRLEQYFQDNRTYVGACAAGTVAPLPDAASTRYFDITCPALNAATYTVHAESRANVGLGAADDYIYEINQANVKTTTKFKGTTVAKNCWLVTGSEC